MLRARLVFLSPAPLTSTRPYTCHLVPKIHSVRNRQRLRPAVFGDDRWARRRRANRRLTAQTQTFPGHSSSPKGKGEGAQRLFLHGRYTSRLWLAILWTFQPIALSNEEQERCRLDDGRWKVERRARGERQRDKRPTYAWPSTDLVDPPSLLFAPQALSNPSVVSSKRPDR